MDEFKVEKVWEGSNNINLINEDKTIRFNLKWDGCIDLWRSYNGYTVDDINEDKDYIHICDIDEFIEQLQQIKEFGINHFKNDYWTK
jgi:hypothetical protein